MAHRHPAGQVAIARRSFLKSIAALGASAGLLNCRQNTADAAQAAVGALDVASFRRPYLSDRQVLQHAFAAWVVRGGVLNLEPNRIYDLGVQRDASNVFVVFGVVNGVLAGNGATLRIASAVGEYYNLLYLAHYNNLRIENLSCVDTAYRDQGIWAYQSGARFIVLDASLRDSVDLTLDNVSGEGLVSFITMQGLEGGPRVRGVRIAPNCRASRVFYGLSCQHQGDDVTGGFTANNCARPYFPYGVIGHDLSVRVHHDGAEFGPTAECAVPIKSYGRRTSGIRLDITFSGVLPWTGACVTLEHQHDPGAGPSIIEDVDMRIAVASGTSDPNHIPRLLLRSYRANGTIETGRTRNVWRRIRISGNLRPGTAPSIVSRSLPDSPADISIASGTIGADAPHRAAPGFQFHIE